MSATHCYRVFDVVIESEVPLALPGALRGSADIEFALLAEPPPAEASLLHEWRTASGELTLAVFSIASPRPGQGPGFAWKLFIPDGGDFYIAGDLSQVCCLPDPGADHATLEHLLLDQVLPRVMAGKGQAVLHGSCVRFEDGRVFAFVGDTGAGKSTLAQGCLAAGAELLTDDSFIVRAGDSEVELVPGYRSLRLWPEIAGQYYGAGQTQSMAHYSDKQRVGLEPDIVTVDRLDGLLVLEGEASALNLRAIESAAERVMLLLSSSFALDPAAEGCHSNWLQTYQHLVAAGMPVYRVSFPWELTQLPVVVQRLKEVL